MADDWFGTGPKTTRKRRSIPKAVKETVWRKYNGNRMNGKCYVCKAPTSFTTFEVGHNRAHSKGGSSINISNLRPICRSCNRSMGTMSIEAFKKKHFGTRSKPKKKSTPAKKKRTRKRTTHPKDPFNSLLTGTRKRGRRPKSIFDI